MPDSHRDLPVPLSVSNVKTLIRKFTTLSKRVAHIDEEISDAVAEDIATDVRANVAGIPDVDGNYDSTRVLRRRAPRGVQEVIWKGSQIAYVEFGTGAVGAAGDYPGPAMPQAGYHPDPTKKSWWYHDAESDLVTLSHGLAPQAPMYNAATVARAGGAKARAQTITKGALDAVTL